MKLKKALTLLIASAVVCMGTSTASASTLEARNGQPHPSRWDVLVLVLPDTSTKVNPYKEEKQVTTMHYAEIQKITELANKLEGYSTNNVYVDVDVKVDYDDITSTTFGHGIGKVVNVDKQIKNNSTMNEYDSILVVYRNVDGSVNMGTNRFYSKKTPETNNATTSALILNDADHKLEKFSQAGAEQFLLQELLESVNLDLRLNNPSSDLKAPPSYYSENPNYSKHLFLEYMNDSSNGNIGSYWSNFVAR